MEKGEEGKDESVTIEQSLKITKKKALSVIGEAIIDTMERL